MADRKTASLKKKLAPRKPKITKAPGKPDPKFLDRLSEALRAELEGAGPPAAAPAAVDRFPPAPEAPTTAIRPPSRGRDKTPPASVDKPASRSEKKSPKGAAPTACRGAGKAPGAASPRAGAVAAGAGKNRRAALLKELKSLLEELDEEGLDFLLEQAHVHRYNMEVERLNEAEERREAGRAEAGAAGGRAASRTPPLRIERSRDGETYHVVSGGRYKMFSAEEMLALVRIAHANPEDAVAGRGLYRWMSRERTDALADLGFAGPSDSGLAGLAALLRKSFAAPPKRA